MEWGATHGYAIICCVIGAPSHIYIGGREEQPKEAPK